MPKPANLARSWANEEGHRSRECLNARSDMGHVREKEEEGGSGGVRVLVREGTLH